MKSRLMCGSEVTMGFEASDSGHDPDQGLLSVSQSTHVEPRQPPGQNLGSEQTMTSRHLDTAKSLVPGAHRIDRVEESHAEKMGATLYGWMRPTGHRIEEI
jgi:hypothetical protein